MFSLLRWPDGLPHELLAQAKCVRGLASLIRQAPTRWYCCRAGHGKTRARQLRQVGCSSDREHVPSRRVRTLGRAKGRTHSTPLSGSASEAGRCIVGVGAERWAARGGRDTSNAQAVVCQRMVCQQRCSTMQRCNDAARALWPLSALPPHPSRPHDEGSPRERRTRTC